jgi:type II secretory pathway component PulM
MHGKAQWPLAGLLRELEAIEQVFAEGTGPVRLSALCWMATVVAAMPPGEVQDQVEDRLSALIAQAAPGPEALRDVLAFRRHGMLAAPWPTTPMPTLRRGGPPAEPG